MSTKNLIKRENKFAKDYFAKVVSNDDPLRRGRLQVKIEAIMGDIPFWTNCTNQIGKVNLQLIPEPDDIVTVKFKNKDIYSGEWELKGNPVDGTDERNIDPKKYGFYDDQGNCIVIDRANNNIIVTAMNDYNVTVQNCMNIIVQSDVNMTVNGNVNQTVSGNVTQNVSGNIDSTSAKMTIHNDLHVDGTISSDTEVVAKTIKLTEHKHKYVPGDKPKTDSDEPTA